jgi:heterodisulfide reductase subunit A-like polyferredoxin
MNSPHRLAHLALAVAMAASTAVSEHVIVVGGGLAGLSAAIEAVQSGRANVRCAQLNQLYACYR